MSFEEAVNKSIANAVASVEIEGFQVDDARWEWCRKLLMKGISFEQYLAYAKRKVGPDEWQDSFSDPNADPNRGRREDSLIDSETITSQ